jgi:cytochrome c oxidase cbb3-type subunit 3
VDGRGNPALGAPNLFDNVWLYGGDIVTVVNTVRDGRSGVMPAWRARLTADEARLIAAWVVAQGSARVASR